MDAEAKAELVAFLDERSRQYLELLDQYLPDGPRKNKVMRWGRDFTGLVGRVFEAD
jgi:hypothetical protein